jgi:hypothetical protein
MNLEKTKSLFYSFFSGSGIYYKATNALRVLVFVLHCISQAAKQNKLNIWQLIMPFIASFISRYFEGSYKSKGKGKGKAIPLRAWTGPGVPSTMRPPYYRIGGT